MALGIAVALAGFTSSPAGAATGLFSNFDSSAQGWTSLEVTDPFEWRVGGGAPGGHVTVARGTGGAAGIVSPDSWGGNRTDAYGGVITFDIRLDPAITGNSLELILDSGNPAINDVYASFGSQLSIPEWQRRTVAIKPGPVWFRNGGGPVNETAFKEVLGSLDRVIVAVTLSGTNDRVYFDNVKVASNVKRKVTLGHKGKRFFGRINPNNACAKNQKVTVYRKRGGPDAKVKTVRTDSRREYGFRLRNAKAGSYYAAVAKSFATGGGNCLAARSKRLVVR